MDPTYPFPVWPRVRGDPSSVLVPCTAAPTASPALRYLNRDLPGKQTTPYTFGPTHPIPPSKDRDLYS